MNGDGWLQKAVGPVAVALVGEYLRLLRPQLAPYGLTPVRWGILSRIHFGKANTQSGLTRQIPVTQPAISNHVRILVDAGMLRRYGPTRNNVPRFLALTPAAEALMPELIAIAYEVDDILWDGISDEDRAAFLRIARAIIGNSG